VNIPDKVFILELHNKKLSKKAKQRNENRAAPDCACI
jgi:hypothetical protein